MLKPSKSNAVPEQIPLAEHALERPPPDERESQPLTMVTHKVGSTALDSNAALSESGLLDAKFSEAGRVFIELLKERLLDQGYAGEGNVPVEDTGKSTPRKQIVRSKRPKGQQKQFSIAHRTTEMADKFMRIVEEHCSGMPLLLPADSVVFSDRRILGMLNSREFIPDVSLTYGDREIIIKRNVPELYNIFRKRFFCDILGKPIKLDEQAVAEAKSVARVSSSGASEVLGQAETSLTDIEGPAVGEALRAAATPSLVEGEHKDQGDSKDSSDVSPLEVDEPTASDPNEPFSEVRKVELGEGRIERKPIEWRAVPVTKPFSAQLLSTKLIEVEFQAIFESFLEARTDLVTVLDLLNLPRRELLAAPNLGEKRLSDVQNVLSHLHPGVGLLFASVQSFPVPVEVVDQLGRLYVQPSIIADGVLKANRESHGIPVDNGLRLTQMTAEIIKYAGITPQMHSAIAERFYAAGFPRPKPRL